MAVWHVASCAIPALKYWDARVAARRDRVGLGCAVGGWRGIGSDFAALVHLVNRVDLAERGGLE